VSHLLSSVALLAATAEHEAETFLGLPLWIWQLANLAAFLAVLGYLVARPLAQAFRRRQEAVEERIQQAKNRREEAARLESQIHERMARQGTHAPWEEFRAANEDLFAFRPGVLDAYYTKETLSSDLARRVFVLPLPARQLAKVAAATAAMAGMVLLVQHLEPPELAPVFALAAEVVAGVLAYGAAVICLDVASLRSFVVRRLRAA